MAFSKSVEYDTGVIVDDSYINIVSVNGNKESLTVYLNYYASDIARQSNKLPLKQAVYSFVPDASLNSLRWDKQAYEYLKTLPEFEDAIDVLEE